MTGERKFPSFDAYQSTLQHPETCFFHDDLRSGKLEVDLWGFPRVRSGGFALTYKVTKSGNQYAVRCFHKNVHDRYLRYQAIHATILKIQNPNLLHIRYSGKGIKVGKNWYPITIMPWVDGDTLENHIYKNIANPKALEGLLIKFRQCISRLQIYQIAHGDLSHQNILVHQGELILVDYDGMFVNSLFGRKSCEIGHSNFQHPGRTMEHFNANIDRFSSIVIYLALKALSIHPSLWRKYEQSGEGLLFRHKDFTNPYGSKLLQELETFHTLRKYIQVFRKICLSNYENIPSLEDFLALNIKDMPHDEVYTHKTYKIDREVALDASKRYPLINQIGKIVTVVGRVHEIHIGKTMDGHPHIYLNFGNWKAKCFTVLIWGDGYDSYIKEYQQDNPIISKWVSITGLLTSYQNRPQIALDTPFGIEILSGEDEACFRLGQAIPDQIDTNDMDATIAIYQGQTNVGTETVQPKVNFIKIRKNDMEVFTKINELYSHKNNSSDGVK